MVIKPIKLYVKTGMKSEYDIAKKSAAGDVVVLGGAATAAELDAKVDHDCTAIISFGLCGGLTFKAQVGERLIATVVKTPDGNYPTDNDWMVNIFVVTRAEPCPWWSSGEFNTANTIVQRKELFDRTQCWVIDDETYAVAQFAAKRGIPFAALRVVSDSAEDNLPPAVVDAIDKKGGVDIFAVIKSIAKDPDQLASLYKTAQEYDLSLRALRLAAKQVGPYFCCPTPK